MTTTEPICPRCGQLMIRGWDHINCQDRADTLRAQRAADSKEHLETWKRLKQAEAERDALYRKATDEVWYWQGDGYDIPESLACPVLMDADTLRDLLGRVAMRGERDQLAAEAVRLREALTGLLEYDADPMPEDRQGYNAKLDAAREALAATPQAAKAAERVQVLGDVAKFAKLVRECCHIEPTPHTGDGYIEALETALDRLDALDKPEVQE